MVKLLFSVRVVAGAFIVFLGGVSAFNGAILGGLILAIFGFLLMPPVRQFIASRTGVKINSFHWLCAVVVVVFVYAHLAKKFGSGDAAVASIEYQLATINSDAYVADDDISVTRFRYLLDSISAKTGNDKKYIGDITVSLRKSLRDDYGRDIGLLELMERANKMCKSSTENIQYGDVILALKKDLIQ